MTHRTIIIKTHGIGVYRNLVRSQNNSEKKSFFSLESIHYLTTSTYFITQPWQTCFEVMIECFSKNKDIIPHQLLLVANLCLMQGHTLVPYGTSVRWHSRIPVGSSETKQYPCMYGAKSGSLQKLMRGLLF